MEEFALSSVCVVVRWKTGIGWYTVLKQATRDTPNTIDGSRGHVYGTKRLTFTIFNSGVQVVFSWMVSIHQEGLEEHYDDA